MSSPSGQGRAASAQSMTGRLLSGRYLVGACLGAGAMGAVYRAEHVLMKKVVAIKVLHADLTRHGELVERFHREAQAAAHIDHPNVCAASDFGETDDGAFFLVMEYLSGRTLAAELAASGPFEPARAVHLADLANTGTLERLPAARRLTLALSNARSCSDRLAIVRELEELGDPTTLPVLAELDHSPRKGCGFLDLSDCNACLRRDLRRAIEHLEGR